MPDEFYCKNCGEVATFTEYPTSNPNILLEYCEICGPAFSTDDLDTLRQTMIEQRTEIEWLKEQLLWMYQEHTCCTPTDVWKKLTGKI